ncbi:MAG: carboxypeptidase regulatory-like domain-containing protein [Vicinamibacterales bacterium]
MKFSVACLFAMLVLVPSVVFAQATINGTVKDTSGAVLPGVTVEAASPVLIEKVRTVVSDGNGRYQLVDLRPGAYTVTFTLAGFNTFKRDGVTLSGSGTVVIDADLRVGALEETVTVTGEAPVVDTQSLTQQRVLNADTIDALPSARNYFGVARMIPGTQGGGNDVGGSLIQDVGQSVTVHGSRNVDQRITINGINTMTLQAGGNIGGQTPDMGSAAEVTVDTTSLGADLPTGGVRVNFVPKDGGNRFADSAFFSMTNESLQGDNFSDELRARGLGTPNKILHSYDVNESLGGPFKRDKVWFWASFRYNDVANEAPVFTNANAFNPAAWAYVPTTEPGVNKGKQSNNSIRVTWQASPRNKIAGTYKADKWCNCPSQMSATLAPEAARDRRFPRLRQEHAEWTSPVTSKLLLEVVGMHLFENWGDQHLRSSTGSLTEAQAAIQPQLVSVTEQSTGLVYRTRGPVYNNTTVPSLAFRVGASYVTGSHAFKFGYNRTNGYLKEVNYQLNDGRSYRFNNGIPNQITERAVPFTAKTNLDADQGLYAQDRWTLNRMTIAGAIRFDMFNTSFPDQTMGPAPFTPNRNISFPAADNISWRDLTYRSGVSYDLFGNGKTAVKVAFNKYLLGQTLNGLGRSPNPVLAAVTTATRTWADANQDFVPQCDLTSTAANGECGVMSNLLFGSATAGDRYDSDLISGFNHRQTNWELTTSVQHELMPRVAIDVGYFRRVWANFQVTDNTLTTAADYTRFTYNQPADARLPNGGNYSIAGFYDVNPNKVGQVSNLNLLSGDVGEMKEHWNGVDLGINARLQNGLVLNGGVSTGRTMTDNCDIVSKLPEMLDIGATAAQNLPAGKRSDTFCHNEEPWLTQIKAFGTYTLPKLDVQISGTFRNVNGVSVLPVITANTAALGANSTLGRAPTGTTSLNLQLLEPNQDYLDRRNELDMRFGKVIRFGRARSTISWDVFNLINNNAVITANQAAASYLRPTEILNARVMKFTVAFDF